jgi:endoglucanase
MNRGELLALARRVLTLPTAPYHEERIRALVVDFCRQLPNVRVGQDRAGNVIARYRRDVAKAPLVFVAHMDHPGFELLGGNRAEFLGGVPKEMFAKGTGIRCYSGMECGGLTPPVSRAGSTARSVVRATITRFDASAWPKRKLVTLRADGALRRGDFGMWDLPAFRVTGGKLHAAAIDDVLGTAVMLATLAEVCRRNLRAHVWCAFTRAEEVGFQGALALMGARKIPRSALVVSIEMS